MRLFTLLLTSSLFLFTFLNPLGAQAQSGSVECLDQGTVTSIIEGINRHLDPRLLSPCYKQILNAENPGSAERTTAGATTPADFDGSQGLIPRVTNNLAFMLGTPPVSSTEYFANLIENIGLPVPKPAYAQTGVGFNALRPTLPLWVANRNLAYMVYIIISMIASIMIMIRQKIDPQTVVNLQNALPRLVITLILITFSYAIAGFLIDLIYIGIYIPAFLFEASNIFKDASEVIRRLTSFNLLGIMFGGGSFFNAEAANAIGNLVDAIIGANGGEFFGWLTSTLGRLITGILITVAMFQLFIKLGIGFVQIIVSVILAPLLILPNALPGSQAFSKWLRNILANVVMFPAVAIFFMIAAALLAPPEDNAWGVIVERSYGDRSSESSAWTPPFLVPRTTDISGNEIDPQNVVSPLSSIIGFMIILMSPGVAQAAKDALKVEKSSLGSAIGQTIGYGTAAAGIPVRYLRQQKEQAVQADRQAKAFSKYLGK